MKNISIIQYQNVTPRHELSRLWLPLHAFESQIAWFGRGPSEMLSMDDALATMTGDRHSNRRPFALTFDNGYEDVAIHAAGLLAEHAFPATLFMSPDRVGTTLEVGGESVSYLDWPQLRELSANGFTIGAYIDDAWDINRIPERRVTDAVVSYARRLEDGIGSEVRYFGVKEGVPNRQIRGLLEANGYRAFLTQCPTFRRATRWAIGRIQVDDDDFNIFLTKTSKAYLFFKDKRTWRYIRKYKLDRVAHRMSETFDALRGR